MSRARSVLAHDENHATGTGFGFQAVWFEQLIELLPRGRPAWFGDDPHARRHDFGAEDQRKTRALQHTKSVFEQTALKHGLARIRDTRPAQQQGDAAHNVPHTMAILARARRSRHKQLPASQTVLESAGCERNTKSIFRPQPVNRSMKDDARRSFGD